MNARPPPCTRVAALAASVAVVSTFRKTTPESGISSHSRGSGIHALPLPPLGGRVGEAVGPGGRLCCSSQPSTADVPPCLTLTSVGGLQIHC